METKQESQTILHTSLDGDNPQGNCLHETLHLTHDIYRRGLYTTTTAATTTLYDSIRFGLFHSVQ